jgi:hypothetical protein
LLLLDMGAKPAITILRSPGSSKSSFKDSCCKVRLASSFFNVSWFLKLELRPVEKVC